MGTLKVQKLVVEKFRRFANVEFAFHDKVKLIAGQNGTQKSTLLGMLAQPFQFGVLRGSTAKKPDNSVYTTNYHGMKLHEFIDYTGNYFLYDCEDVFRLSKIHDHPNNKYYEYQIMLKGSIISADSPIRQTGLTVYSKHKDKKGAPDNKAMRFVAGPGKSHEGGEGNFPHPVIYLGLNRLWPLALEKKCEVKEHNIDKDSIRWFSENYNTILCIEDREIKAEFLDTHQKDGFFAPSAKNYNGESCSAGQDNLGQILTAILSFRDLKKKLKEKYCGGILLIDELDSTFHSHAQKELLKILVSASEELDLQIIATTHSLTLLEQAYRSRLKSSIKVMYLLAQDDNVIEASFSDFDEIVHHLNVTSPVPQPKRNKKATVIFEDEVAKHFFSSMVGTTLNAYIHFVNMESTGAGNLAKLAHLSSKVPELSSTIIMPDGDVKKELSATADKLIFLPGDHRPETLIYRLLFALKESDEFWATINSTYNRDVALIRNGGRTLEKGDDKEWVKSWYKEQSKYWGRGSNLVFRRWIKQNKDEAKNFCKRFCQRLNVVCDGTIPKSKVQAILAKFE